MSQENVAIVEMLLEKFRAGDHDVFEYYDDAIEWDATRGAEHVAEIANLYRGHEGVRAYWRAWLAAWQPIEVWDYELRDAGESVVALIADSETVVDIAASKLRCLRMRWSSHYGRAKWFDGLLTPTSARPSKPPGYRINRFDEKC